MRGFRQQFLVLSHHGFGYHQFPDGIDHTIQALGIDFDHLFNRRRCGLFFLADLLLFPQSFGDGLGRDDLLLYQGLADFFIRAGFFAESFIDLLLTGHPHIDQLVADAIGRFGNIGSFRIGDELSQPAEYRRNLLGGIVLCTRRQDIFNRFQQLT